jgi:hypothetical protein
MFCMWDMTTLSYPNSNQICGQEKPNFQMEKLNFIKYSQFNLSLNTKTIIFLIHGKCNSTTTIVWEVTPCNLVDRYSYQCFGEIRFFHDGLEVLIPIIIKSSYLLGYNDVYSGASQSIFRRNVSPPSSGSKSKQSKKPA